MRLVVAGRFTPDKGVEVKGSRIYRCVMSLGLTLAFASGLQSQPVATRIEFGGEDDLGLVLERPRALLLSPVGPIVVEGVAPHLKLLDNRGMLRQTLGKAGGGPGEYRYVSTAVYDRVGRTLIVFDAAQRRAVRYALGDSLRFSGTSPAPFHVQSACFLGGQLWAVGVNGNDGIVHQLAYESGSLVVRRSGGTFKVGNAMHSNPLFREQVVQAAIHCDEERSEILIASRILGVVQRLRVADMSVSTHAIPGFESVVITAEGRRLTIGRGPSGSSDEVIALRRDLSGYRAIVGKADARHGGNGDYRSIREVGIVDSKPSPPIPRAEAEVDRLGQMALCYVGAPYPKGALVTRGNCR
jgi:hypothetical protein